MKPGPLHWFTAAAAVGLFTVGAWAAAHAWPVAGTALIFAFGLGCLLLALVADRIDRVSYEKGKLVAEMTPATTGELKEIGLSGAAATYAFVHNQLADDAGSAELKVKLQDQLVDMVKQNAFNEPVNPERAATAIRSGSPAERVLAFGWLQADPTAATLPLLLQGIEHSRSGNEQYHALLAAEARQPTLSPDEVRELQAAIERAPYIDQDPDRREVAERILGHALPARSSANPDKAPA